DEVAPAFGVERGVLDAVAGGTAGEVEDRPVVGVVPPDADAGQQRGTRPGRPGGDGCGLGGWAEVGGCGADPGTGERDRGGGQGEDRGADPHGMSPFVLREPPGRSRRNCRDHMTPKGHGRFTWNTSYRCSERRCGLVVPGVYSSSGSNGCSNRSGGAIRGAPPEARPRRPRRGRPG